MPKPYKRFAQIEREKRTVAVTFQEERCPSPSRTEVLKLHDCGALGAVVTGIDLSKDLDSAQLKDVKSALNEFLVLLFVTRV